jgi:hypothetical protein
MNELLLFGMVDEFSEILLSEDIFLLVESVSFFLGL